MGYRNRLAEDYAHRARSMNCGACGRGGDRQPQADTQMRLTDSRPGTFRGGMFHRGGSERDHLNVLAMLDRESPSGSTALRDAMLPNSRWLYRLRESFAHTRQYPSSFVHYFMGDYVFWTPAVPMLDANFGY